MDRDLLNHIPIVLAVARRGGFAAAASELGTSASNVSHAVKAVEERLGESLFNRTTRSVSLTQAGEQFVSVAGGAVSNLVSMWENIQSDRSGASGVLRINAPRITLDWVLKPILHVMQANYPNVIVEVFFDDGLTDVVAEGFDAGVRLGRMVSQDMVVVRLAPAFRVIIVASPEYVKAYGEPKSINELTKHNCIQYRMTSAGNVYRWDLREKRNDVQVQTQGTIVVNDMLHALSLSRDGLGLCYTFEPLASEDLKRKTLVQILPQAGIKEDGLSLYFPKQATMAPKLRAFIDTAKEIR